MPFKVEVAYLAIGAGKLKTNKASRPRNPSD